MTAYQLFDCRLPAGALAKLEDPFLSGQLAAGPAVGQLEKHLSYRFGGREAVAVGDMTQALFLTLRLAGVIEGDEVLTLSFNCMSSNCAIAMVGARVVWVDVDPQTASFDIDHARRQLSARTRAVIVYHVAGYPADLDQIRQFCDMHGLILIEDANNAFGATFNDRPVGMAGNFAVLSLYANRQINAIDGGVVLCQRAEDADHARRMRRFGIDITHFRDTDGEIDLNQDISEIGISSNLNNVNATLGLLGLADVDLRIARSRHNAAALTEATREMAVDAIVPVQGAQPVYWAWLIRVANRNAMMRELKSRGVACSKLHHPNHYYTGFGTPADDLAGTTILQNEMLAIPCGWWIDRADIPELAMKINDSLKATD